MKKLSTHHLVLIAFFMGIMMLMYAFPFLGYIPLGAINATTMHIPVIIASIVIGPKTGAFLGGFFGLTSILRNTTHVTLTSFVFSPFISGHLSSLMIALFPRILIGILPYYIFNLLQKKERSTLNKHSFSLFFSGFLGSLTNTLLVMHFIYLFFLKEYATALGHTTKGFYQVILGVILTSGIPEAIIAGFFTATIASTLLKTQKRIKKRS